MKYLSLIILITLQSSCISRWVATRSVDNLPRQTAIVPSGDFNNIDKDGDGVISQEEFVEEKEKVLDAKNLGYLWAFLGIVIAVTGACCVPFVYMFTTKHVKLSWAKVASWREKQKEKDESSTEI